MTYAQLDFTSNTIRRVNLIGGAEVGIIQSLIDKYPDQFVNLEGRENVPLDDIDWYYNTETDTFIRTADLPVPEEPSEPEPSEPTQLDRIEAAVKDIAKNSTSYDEMAAAIAEGVNDV